MIPLLCQAQKKPSKIFPKGNKETSIYSNSSTSDGCGLIQITVIYDNNCNGIFDNGDSSANSVEVSILSNRVPVESSYTSQNGYAFFPNLNAGNYSFSIAVPNGWEVTSSTSNVNITANGVGTLEYFLCQSCDCFDTSGPPKQNLFIPNDVYPNNGIPFMIIDNDFSPHVQGAYNSNEYLLVIFNRWGGEVHRSTRKDCNGLKNGEIEWDGKDKNGKQLQQDNYNGYLVLQNCDYSCKNDEWTSNFFNGLLNRCPKNVRYFNILLIN